MSTPSAAILSRVIRLQPYGPGGGGKESLRTLRLRQCSGRSRGPARRRAVQPEKTYGVGKPNTRWSAADPAAGPRPTAHRGRVRTEQPPWSRFLTAQRRLERRRRLPGSAGRWTSMPFLAARSWILVNGARWPPPPSGLPAGAACTRAVRAVSPTESACAPSPESTSRRISAFWRPGRWPTVFGFSSDSLPVPTGSPWA